MHDDRLAKRVFLWEHDLDLNNWTSDIGKICEKLCLDDSYNNMLPVSLQAAKAQAVKYQEEMWKITVNGKPKLRKYKDFRLNMTTEPYVKLNLNRKERSLLAQLRCGILPLRIETGRFRAEKVEDRLCIFCN
jgi:hypothetical protein